MYKTPVLRESHTSPITTSLSRESSRVGDKLWPRQVRGTMFYAGSVVAAANLHGVRHCGRRCKLNGMTASIYHLLLSFLFSSQPLLAIVLDLVQYASLFRLAVPSWRAARTTLPRAGVAVHVLVVDVEVRLSIVEVELVSSRSTVVAYQLVLSTFRKSLPVAFPEFEIAVVAHVLLVVENVELAQSSSTLRIVCRVRACVR